MSNDVVRDPLVRDPWSVGDDDGSAAGTFDGGWFADALREGGFLLAGVATVEPEVVAIEPEPDLEPVVAEAVAIEPEPDPEPVVAEAVAIETVPVSDRPYRVTAWPRMSAPSAVSSTSDAAPLTPTIDGAPRTPVVPVTLGTDRPPTPPASLAALMASRREQAVARRSPTGASTPTTVGSDASAVAAVAPTELPGLSADLEPHLADVSTVDVPDVTSAQDADPDAAWATLLAGRGAVVEPSTVSDDPWSTPVDPPSAAAWPTPAEDASAWILTPPAAEESASTSDGAIDPGPSPADGQIAAPSALSPEAIVANADIDAASAEADAVQAALAEASTSATDVLPGQLAPSDLEREAHEATAARLAALGLATTDAGPGWSGTPPVAASAGITSGASDTLATNAAPPATDLSAPSSAASASDATTPVAMATPASVTSPVSSPGSARGVQADATAVPKPGNVGSAEPEASEGDLWALVGSSSQPTPAQPSARGSRTASLILTLLVALVIVVLAAGFLVLLGQLL